MSNSLARGDIADRTIANGCGKVFEHPADFAERHCDEVQWRFVGLALAGYNALISLLVAALAA
jgi:disulfide bond formation protein DsbB